MPELVHQNPDIYRLPIPLCDSPLRELNSYLIRVDDHALLIDTGFRKQECLDAMQAHLEALDLSFDNPKFSILLTHLHSDHTGLVGHLAKPHTDVFMGETEGHLAMRLLTSAYWVRRREGFLRMGFPPEELTVALTENPSRNFLPEKLPPLRLRRDGEMVRVGGESFRVMDTPGHTPGHISLYHADKKILICGDHILFDIFPNITQWHPFFPNALQQYRASLDRIKELEIKHTFPGHRSIGGDAHERIEQIHAHHEERLAEALDIVRELQDASGYEVASQMRWKMQTTWGNSPTQQRLFAVGEAMSHLENLVQDGKIEVRDDGPMLRFSIK